jgi:equilibrative nucleoside transporter 1/2/3
MANCVPPLPAVSFLAISAFFELLCVLLYAYVFPKLAILKYYYSKAASEGSKTVSADLAAGGIETLLQPEVCHLYLSILVPFV